MRILILLLFYAAVANAQFEIKDKLDGILFPLGTASAGFGNLITHESDPLTNDQIINLDIGEINFFDKPAIGFNENSALLSDILISIQMASTGLFTFSDLNEGQFNSLSVMYYQTMTFNYGLNASAKKIFQRKRPFVYSSDAPDKEKLTKDAAYSFYSGHSSTAFASAVFNSIMISEYISGGWKPVGIGLNLLNASLIAYLRVNAGKHFPTDVITGAIIGSTIAYIITEIHRTDKKNIPINNDLSTGIYRFNFSLPF